MVLQGRLQEWRDGGWSPVSLRNATEGWDPAAITAIAFDGRGRLWVGTSQGVAVRDARGAGASSIRHAAFPCSASRHGRPARRSTPGSARAWARCASARRPDRVPAGAAMAAPRRGARGRRRRGRHGLVRHARWHRRHRGHARPRWPARPRPTKRRSNAVHRRTPYGYVVEAHLTTPGDPRDGLHHRQRQRRPVDRRCTAPRSASRTRATQRGRTRSARARPSRRSASSSRSRSGGTPAPPMASRRAASCRRAVPIPTCSTAPERDRRRQQQRDALWKVHLAPLAAQRRRPVVLEVPTPVRTNSTATTSSTRSTTTWWRATTPRSAEVAAVVRRITDHLLAHDFTLVDHDGTADALGRLRPGGAQPDPAVGGGARPQQPVDADVPARRAPRHRGRRYDARRTRTRRRATATP